MSHSIIYIFPNSTNTTINNTYFLHNKRGRGSIIITCFKCHSPSLKSQMRKCLNCTHYFCSSCQIHATNISISINSNTTINIDPISTSNWICSYCNVINEEQSKINLNQLSSEVNGIPIDEHKVKCEICNQDLEGISFETFTNSNDVIEYLSSNTQNGVYNRDDLRKISRMIQEVTYEPHRRICEGCLCQFITSKENSDLLLTVMGINYTINNGKEGDEDGEEVNGECDGEREDDRVKRSKPIFTIVKNDQVKRGSNKNEDGVMIENDDNNNNNDNSCSNNNNKQKLLSPNSNVKDGETDIDTNNILSNPSSYKTHNSNDNRNNYNVTNTTIVNDNDNDRDDIFLNQPEVKLNINKAKKKTISNNNDSHSNKTKGKSIKLMQLINKNVKNQYDYFVDINQTQYYSSYILFKNYITLMNSIEQLQKNSKKNGNDNANCDGDGEDNSNDNVSLIDMNKLLEDEEHNNNQSLNPLVMSNNENENENNNNNNKKLQITNSSSSKDNINSLQLFKINY